MRICIPLIVLSFLCLTGAGCSNASGRAQASAKTPPFSGMRYAVTSGKRDMRDLYKSAVKVEFSGDGREFCSGVLLNPYLVLSAAHCFCAKTPPAGALVIDRGSARCDMRVSAVKAFSYGSDGNKKRADVVVSKGKMEIEIHPDYKSEYGSNGDLIESRADLAAIHLTEPILEASPVGP